MQKCKQVIRIPTHFHIRPPLASQKPRPDSEAFLDDGNEVTEACKEMDAEKLELLMQNKRYTANEYNKQNGATPLHWAVRHALQGCHAQG